MRQCGSNAEEVREIHFYRRGSEVRPSEIVATLYSQLDKLAAMNEDVALSRSYKGEAERLRRHYEDAAEVFIGAIEQVKQAGVGLAARISFNQGQARDFRVVPRTNMKVALKKRPNIVYLVDENDGTLILREARDDRNERLKRTHSKVVFKKHYRGEANSKSDLAALGKLEDADVVGIQEPGLVLALEQVYAEKVAPRVTPHMRVVGTSNEWMWYLRNFLPSLGDSSVDIKQLLTYNGTFNGLGLMDVLDAQHAHYCINSGGSVVNIDPDRIVWTPSRRQVDNHDWNCFKGIFGDTKQDHYMPALRLNSAANPLRNEAMQRVQKALGDSTLLDYLPLSIRGAPAINALRADNAFSE